LVGASSWEQQLFTHLVEHERDEQVIIRRYQDACASSESEAFTYLIGLILEDEDRHHRFTMELANALRSDVELADASPRVPMLKAWKPVDRSIVEATEEFLRLEREDAKHLKDLARELRDTRDTTLWHLLVSVMLADTEKHLHILEFLREHLRSGPPAE
jgi:bacterioferritin (cytochrome b1)